MWPHVSLSSRIDWIALASLVEQSLPPEIQDRYMLHALGDSMCPKSVLPRTQTAVKNRAASNSLQTELLSIPCKLRWEFWQDPHGPISDRQQQASAKVLPSTREIRNEDLTALHAYQSLCTMCHWQILLHQVLIWHGSKSCVHMTATHSTRHRTSSSS